MESQGGALPGKTFGLRIVGDQVDVPIGRGNAVVCMRVQVAHPSHV
jgi:hypothetical protein